MSTTHPTQITFTPPGTESASRSLADKLSDVLSVKDYGAKCDGATNDYPALAAMLTVLGSTAATLIVPGPCRVDTSITIPATLPVRFEGAGAFTGAGVVTFTIWGGAPVTGAPVTGAPVTRAYASDANDVLRYSLDETAGPWANSGSAGSAPLSLASGTVTPRAGIYPGVGTALGRGVAFRGVSQDCIAGAATVEPAYPVTLSLWWLQLGASNGCNIFQKLSAATWVSPFIALGIGISDGSGNALFQINAGAGGLINVSGTMVYDRVITGGWNLLVGVYDGANASMYVNGNLAASVAKTGAINYGTHGNWTTEQPSTGAGTITGVADEIRLANVARSQAWVEAYWKAGMLL